MDTAFCDLIALDPVNQWIESHTDVMSVNMGDGRLLTLALPTENNTDDGVHVVVEETVRTEISDMPFPILDDQYGNEVLDMFGSYTINDEPPKLDELSLPSYKNCGVQNLHNFNGLSTKQHGYVCVLCGKQFCKMKAVDNHFMEHHSFPVGEHLSKCGAKCKRSMPKIEHKCDICNRIYSTRHSLNQHISAVHLGERRFCCEYCGAKFGAPGTLRRHRNTVHLNKMLYCHYEGCVHPGFKCSKALKAHIQAYHTHERPYSCSFCGRGFVRRNDMNFHEKRHLRADPMRCRKCGCYLWSSQTLKNHEKHCKSVRFEEEIRNVSE